MQTAWRWFTLGIIIFILNLENAGIDRFPVFHPHNGAIWGQGGPQFQPRPGALRLHDSNQVYNIRTPTQTQVSGFVKNGNLDLRAAYQEVCRRTSQCDNFNCSFERFKPLSLPKRPFCTSIRSRRLR